MRFKYQVDISCLTDFLLINFSHRASGNPAIGAIMALPHCHALLTKNKDIHTLWNTNGAYCIYGSSLQETIT